MKTPGVYIVEKNAFPNSIVEVATAVPAFIGYTEKADNRGLSLLNTPFKITTMAEFTQFFGGPPPVKFKVRAALPADKVKKTPAETPDFTALPPVDKKAQPPAPVGPAAYVLEPDSLKYLYFAMRHFFLNGGGPCYIVSVGSHAVDVDLTQLQEGVDQLKLEAEPTLVVIPDAVLLANSDACISLQQHMLAHCGEVMKNRFAILDIYNGDKDARSADPGPVEAFRNSLGVNNLKYGAAYYPWVRATIMQDRDIGYLDFINPTGTVSIADLIATELADAIAEETAKNIKGGLGEVVRVLQLGADETKWTAYATEYFDKNVLSEAGKATKATGDKERADWLASKSRKDWVEVTKSQANQTLLRYSEVYKTLARLAAARLNLLPPSAAMAGIYTSVDNARGVWKAPANHSVSYVSGPAVNISNYDQEDLNVTPTGKSINAIRTFIGEGTLVWGARTLDGNSLDWRYINVRRTMIMLEESCKLAAKALVFEPNVENTWETIRAMIQNYLTSVWKRGGLAGAVPADAFQVFVGLGETMTPEDILEGILRVTVLVAVSRPAEFIEITFQQQMQKS